MQKYTFLVDKPRKRLTFAPVEFLKELRNTMEKEYKSEVDWIYHLANLLVIGNCVVCFMHTNVAAIIISLLMALLVLHVFFNTYYRITADGMLVAHCSIFPEKRIAIERIEAVEPTLMPVSSYALSLNRLIVWADGKPWMLISPVNRANFIKELQKINPSIQIKSH